MFRYLVKIRLKYGQRGGGLNLMDPPLNTPKIPVLYCIS